MVKSKNTARKLQTTRLSLHAPSLLLHCAIEREGKSEEYADSIQFRVRDSLLIWKPSSPGPRSDEDDGVTRMGANSIPTDATIDLDEQISQLMQCKPLSEQQVPATLSVDDKLFLCPLTFSSTFVVLIGSVRAFYRI